jgi:hypothetical protein
LPEFTLAGPVRRPPRPQEITVRRRLYAVVAVAALGFALPSHAEAPKTLDGKKVTKIEMKGNGGTQDHDADLITEFLGVTDPADDLTCTPEQCLRFDFIFKPDGVTGDVVVTLGWANDYSDMDLYIYGKDGKEVAHCGGATGTGEFIVLPQAKLVSGDKYTVVGNYYRSNGDDVTAVVEFPATHSATYPSDLDDFQAIGCTE